MNVSVFGLGYVGCVTAACLARDGHQVIGVDVSADKVQMINDGRSPIIEPGLEQLIKRLVREDRLSATTSVELCRRRNRRRADLCRHAGHRSRAA